MTLVTRPVNRQAAAGVKGSGGAYPAPLAIPLPSYSVQETVQPQPSMLQRATVGILHNPFSSGSDPRGQRQSKGKRSYFGGGMGGDVNGNFGGSNRKTVNIDTSEETSDTNVDENEVVEAVHVLPPPMASSASRSRGTTPKSASRYEVFFISFNQKQNCTLFYKRLKKLHKKRNHFQERIFRALLWESFCCKRLLHKPLTVKGHEKACMRSTGIWKDVINFQPFSSLNNKI